jgi:hypothetical protein
MRTIYFSALFIFFLACSKNKDNHDNQTLIESKQKLHELTIIKSEDALALKNVLQKAYAISEKYVDKQHDSLIGVATNLLCKPLLATKPKDARLLCQKGLSIVSRQFAKDADIISRLYRSTALTYYYERDYKTALVYLDSIKITKQDSASQDLKISNLLSVAECYHYLNDFKSAEKIIKEVEPLAET